MAALYLQTYLEMIDKHKDDFAAFKEIHDKFKQDQDTWKIQFDAIGKPILRIVNETENRLCSKMENSSRGKYSANLAEKFRAAVRSDYPLLDLVGVTMG